MEQEGIFKTTPFGGFDKKSVLTYIDTLTEKFQQTEQEYQKQLEGFSKAQDSQVTYIQKMENQLAELEEKLEVLAAQLETERGAAPSPNELNEASDRMAALEQQCRQQEQMVEQHREQARQLQFKMEALEFKSKKYDEISSEVGDALLAARQSADVFARQAQQEAQQGLCTARQQAEECLAQARQESEQTLAQARQEAEQALAQAHRQAQTLVGDTQQRMERFYGELTSFKSDSTRLRKSIEEILFVLNDRIDVMQEVIGQVEKRCDLQQDILVFTEEKQPFGNAADETGLFGEVLHNDENA